MIKQLKIATTLAGLLLLLTIGLAHASESVTGVISESGFSGVVVNDVKYNTGRETKYTPSDYRPLQGDTVTLTYYTKSSRGGGQILAVSTLTLVKKDPNRKELASPANGIVQEVGRKRIRFDFPETNQVISMDKKRGMELVPADWNPAPGDKVKVHFTKVKGRFGNRMVMVISKIEKAN